MILVLTFTGTAVHRQLMTRRTHTLVAAISVFTGASITQREVSFTLVNIYSITHTHTHQNEGYSHNQGTNKAKNILMEIPPPGIVSQDPTATPDTHLRNLRKPTVCLEMHCMQTQHQAQH